MQVKYAIFDMDGTLLDSMYVWDEVGSTYLQRQGIAPPEGLRWKLRDMTVGQTAAYFQTLGVRQPLEEIMEAINAIPYAAYRDEVQPKPGAVAYVQALYKQGVPMCIVSSTDARSIRAALERLHLMRYFRFVLSPNDFGTGKDQPEIFYEAARRLGGEPAETVVFEDSLYAIQTAKAAGFPVVAVADERAAKDRHAIERLADCFLPDLLALSAQETPPLEVPCCAVIVAGGASRRMGFSKQEALLLGVPALVHTLRAFERAKSVQRTVVVCPPGEEGRYRSWLDGWGCTKKLGDVVPGGQTRQQSAAAGAAAAGGCAFVAVHDGARCLITPEAIDRVVADAVRYGASALAVPVKDTIKTADARGLVQGTPPRDTLWAVQTPQVFRADVYRALLGTARGDYTDDCQLFERAGRPVHLCAGEYTNLKLTTPEDLPAAEAVLRRRGRAGCE